MVDIIGLSKYLDNNWSNPIPQAAEKLVHKYSIAVSNWSNNIHVEPLPLPDFVGCSSPGVCLVIAFLKTFPLSPQGGDCVATADCHCETPLRLSQSNIFKILRDCFAHCVRNDIMAQSPGNRGRVPAESPPNRRVML